MIEDSKMNGGVTEAESPDTPSGSDSLSRISRVDQNPAAGGSGKLVWRSPAIRVVGTLLDAESASVPAFRESSSPDFLS